MKTNEQFWAEQEAADKADMEKRIAANQKKIRKEAAKELRARSARIRNRLKSSGLY